MLQSDSSPGRFGLTFAGTGRYTLASFGMTSQINNSSAVGRTIRFGVFEVDLRSGELRKNGLRLKLQEKPFQILAALLERPGEVVTRD